jgi:GcrA cell cycle regulator
MPSASDRLWTQGQLDLLRRDWGRRSPTEIANDVGKTRNAVIGKAHRLFLGPYKPRPPEPKVKPAAATAPKVRLAAPAKPSAPPPATPEVPQTEEGAWQPIADEPAPVAFEDLKKYHCRWPIGSQPHTYCGRPQEDGSAYCSVHARLAQAGLSRLSG